MAVRLASIVLHVGDMGRARRFWAEALGYVDRTAADPSASAVLAPESGPGLTLDEEDGSHVDLAVPDAVEQRAEVERLIGLGARRVEWELPEHADHVVLTDPDGNLFCVIIQP